jgi:membrane associated rhomboid family serine protease
VELSAKQKLMNKLKISYNAPVVLSFALICSVVYIINYIFWGDLGNTRNGLIGHFFVIDKWQWFDWKNYIRIFAYTMGHANTEHLVGNLSIFLLIGPIMEEKYGSKNILTMMLTTAIVTAIFQVIFFTSGLLGASGLVFMFIVLVSFADVKEGTIPLTFIVVVLFFVGKEIMSSMGSDNISQYAHIAGGILGGVFGFTAQRVKKGGAS